MDDTHDATFYVQLEPSISRSTYSPSTVRSIKAVAITLKRPERPRPGTVTIKRTVRVPDAAFLPLAPEAVVVVPGDMTTVNPIEVEAGDPDE